MTALPAATTAANGTEFVSWRHCDVHTRSTFNILSLCLSTLVICVWNAVHPDVPNPRMPRWKVYLARFYGFLVGLFLPEVLVLNALDQFLEAREVLQEMNGEDSESLFAISYWTKLLKEMYPWALAISYWKEAWRPDVSTELTKPRWTMAQAFYAVVGGFHAKSTSGQVTKLWTSEIKSLCQANISRCASFTETAIEDHSKAGALAKALFCWQLLVFIISSIARRAEHLPLSLLEITTLAHGLCGLAAFALWWHKPHSVDEVVVVPIEDSLKGKIKWTQKPFTELELSMLGAVKFVLYVDGDNPGKSVLISLAVAALYGLPHLLGLSTEFPTLAERRCWQVATAILIGSPVFLVLHFWAIQKFAPASELVVTMTVALMIGVFVVYCIASCFIIVESFRQLFALPSGVFVAPALVCYLPHFS